MTQYHKIQNQANSTRILQHQNTDEKKKKRQVARKHFPHKNLFIRILVLLFTIATFLVITILYKMYVSKSDFYLNEANKRSQRSFIEMKPRGVIYDRNGIALAKSISSPSLVIDNKLFLEKYKNSEDIAVRELAEVLKKTPTELYQQIKSRPSLRFQYIAKNLEPNQVDYYKLHKPRATYLEQGYKRIYPFADVISQLIGITNADGKGAEGIELSFNKLLEAKASKEIVERDKKGNVIAMEEISKGHSGESIYLSIDIQVQQLLYNALNDAIKKNKADKGSAIIVDRQTGEILAMANANSYNPNKFTREQILQNGRNSALIDVFEPGSTVKPFVIIEALTNGVTHLDEVIDVSSLNVDGFEIRDVSHHKSLSLAQIISKSSNIGVAKLALRLPTKALYESFKNLGFGSKLNLGIIGEQRGLYPSEKRYWSKIDQAAFAYGYGYAVTISQLAQAYTVLANYGKKIPLTIFKQIKQPKGTQILDPDITKSVVHMMEGVAHPSNNPNATVPNYSVAIKTGTAKKSVNGKYVNKYIAYTAGFAPSRDPKYVMVVMIDNPTAGKYYGGAVSAPVFKDVMSELLALKNIPEDNARSDRRIFNLESLPNTNLDDIDKLIESLNQTKL